MNQLKELIKTILEQYTSKEDCGCGCHGKCGGEKKVAPIIVESKRYAAPISEALRYHIENKVSITENVFRAGSDAHVKILAETRKLWSEGVIVLNGIDKQLFESTDLGKYGFYEGKQVPLDLPMMEDMALAADEEEIADEPISETDKKKNPPIGKPKRGGSKKFYVYVRKPGGGIKKVSFGDTTGLRAKLNNPKARQAFAKRHDCKNKKDRTKASYWSCRLPRYAKLLGFKTSFSGYW